MPGTGLLAACVPGTFETWMMLLRDYGTMPVADVLAPAIGYAQNGHPLLERTNATIATVAELFREYWPTSAAVYLPNNEGAGDRIAVHQQDTRRHLQPHRQGSRERRRRPRRADRARAQIMVEGIRRRSDRPLLPHAGDHGYQRPPPSRRAHRRRHGALDAAYRSAAAPTTIAATPCARPDRGARAR